MSLFENPSSTSPTPAPPVAAPDGSISAFRSNKDTSALRALQTIVEPGTLIHQFQVGKLLGRGSLAAVYEGTDTSTGRRVALKILDARFTSDPKMIERFLAEGDALANFSHPNIVQHVAHGSDDTFSYIAMEFVRGINLDQLIHTIEIEPRHVLHLAREIGKGLTTLHAAGILHGDVKPSNILVTRAGDVKISDFGTAARQQASRAGNTKVYGTAAYMAPELFDPSAAIDYRADIYSLGVTFYKIFTGKVPGDPFVPAGMLNPHLPAGVDSVLARALAPQPDMRYITAKEFCDAIAALFDENAPTTPISAEADSVGAGAASSSAATRAAKQERSGIDWKMVLLCGLAAIGLAATLIVLAVFFGRW